MQRNDEKNVNLWKNIEKQLEFYLDLLVAELSTC